MLTVRKKIRVLIVDDSALTRKILTKILSSSDEIEVIGTATDPYVAREKIKLLQPDVLTLDIEMPKMNGINFLRNLMRLRPMPVIMISSLTQKSADVALAALGLGAVDYVGKPDISSGTNLEDYSSEIIRKIKVAASTNSANTSSENLSLQIPDDEKVLTNGRSLKKRFNKNCKQVIIAVGASTGGTEAINELLCNLQPASYSLVIVQHIPKAFSKAFAERVNKSSPLEVVEAEDKQKILPGHAYIAPGDKHLEIIKKDNAYFCKINNGEPFNRHKPSVDVLFNSVCAAAGHNAIGVLLTGMGSDGARGLKEMQQLGAITIAQDEPSSVVWGMPGAAVKLQAADYILPLDKITDRLTKLVIV